MSQVVFEVLQGQCAADGEQGQRQRHPGGQAEGVVQEDREFADDTRIGHAGEAADDQRVGNQGAQGDTQPLTGVDGLAGVPDQRGHSQHVDDGNDESDENTEPRYACFTQGVQDHGHPHVGVEAVAALGIRPGCESRHVEQLQADRADEVNDDHGAYGGSNQVGGAVVR